MTVDLDGPGSDRDLADAIDDLLAQTDLAIRIVGEAGRWRGELLKSGTDAPLADLEFRSDEQDGEEARYDIYQQVMMHLAELVIDARATGQASLN
jgi:hypothetical protein